MKKTFALVYLATIIIIMYGWLLNIYEIFLMTSVTTGEGILRVLGIFMAPLGAVLGYFA